MKFKKVILSLPPYSSYSSGLLRGFNYLDIKVKYFDYRSLLVNEKIIAGLFGNWERATSLANQRLIRLAKDFQPDLLFVMKGEKILPETIETISSLGIVTANWFPDYVNTFELALKLSSNYDYFFHFDPLTASQLKKKGRKNIYYLPFAADILPSDRKSFKTKNKYNISFIGNYDDYREEYLKSIDDLGLNIWGDKRWAKSSLAHCYRGSQLPNLKFAEVSRASKININIQHEFSCEGLVLRPFEVLGAGAFLLTEDKKEVQRLFGNNIVTFEPPEDLRKKVIYFLAHDKERKKFANKGYLTVRDHHTYIHRLHQILKVIK